MGRQAALAPSKGASGVVQLGKAEDQNWVKSGQ